MSSETEWQPCPVCEGRGTVGEVVCPTCEGTGTVGVMSGRPPQP